LIKNDFIAILQGWDGFFLGRGTPTVHRHFF
jgi:hypothetical protein